MSATILERFMRDASEGVPVWYVLDESKTKDDGFVLHEPSSDGKPWTWVGGQDIANKLLKRAPQATRIWYIDGPLVEMPTGMGEA